MYVRTFKPASGGGLLLNFVHLLAVVVTFGVAFIWFVPGMIEVIYGASFPSSCATTPARSPAGIVGLIALIVLGRARGAVEFGEKNAIDVEAIGLYWHFVDIVWIIIFTAVYLLEYL